jgi:hypothetical protein
MKDYVSSLFDIIKTSSKSEAKKVESNEKSVKSESDKRVLSQPKRKSMKSESAHTDAIQETLDNVLKIQEEFKLSIVLPMRASDIKVNPVSDGDLKLGDKANPHLRAVTKVEEALENLVSQLKMQLSDPLPEDDETVDVTIHSTEGEEMEESDHYYRQMHPELDGVEETIQVNGWNYKNGEIWDDQGLCSISYDKDNDCIHVAELMDPDGVDQETIANVHSVDELDDVLTQFVELDELAIEIKQAFAEYIENQRGSVNEAEDDLEDMDIEGSEEIAPEPIIIDDWEYLASDPEYYGNPTLLYDKGDFVVFIQKDTDPEETEPYYVQVSIGNAQPQDYQSDDIENVCMWLETMEAPVPTEDAVLAFSAEPKAELEESVNEEATEEKEKIKLPKDFKEAPNDEEIARTAKKVESPKVSDTEEK